MADWVTMFVREGTRRTVENTTTTANIRQVMITLIAPNIEKRLREKSTMLRTFADPGLNFRGRRKTNFQAETSLQPCCSFWADATVHQNLMVCGFFFKKKKICVSSTCDQHGTLWHSRSHQSEHSVCARQKATLCASCDLCGSTKVDAAHPENASMALPEE